MLMKQEVKEKKQTIELINDDCLIALKMLQSDSIDLIVTSPPYADQRKKTYGGVSADKYVEWFTPIAKELLRVTKSSGSFVLNIKERAINGERHTYVIELILMMRKLGWLWTEVPMGDWKNSRLKNMSDTDKKRDESKVGSGFGKKIENWVTRDLAYPTNVLHMATECGNRSHSAAFPESLPEWFIKLFTTEGDTVLDPFSGSGTTLKVAKAMKRNAVGIEILDEYCEITANRVGLKKSSQKKYRYTND